MKSSRILLFTLFVFVTITCDAQSSDTITYSVFFKKSCEDSVFYDYHWHLVDEKDNEFLPTDNSVSISSSSKYYIVTSFFNNELIEIKLKNKIEADTFTSSQLNTYYVNDYWRRPSSRYSVCGSSANSMYEEY